jgi:hypothetical protein
MEDCLNPPGPVTFDVLHVILITGFVSFVASVTTHVVTKSKLSGKYVTHADCVLKQEACALAAIKEDISEIKSVQQARTLELRARYEREDEIWRVVFEALKIPAREQNILLASRGTAMRTRREDTVGTP